MTISGVIETIKKTVVLSDNSGLVVLVSPSGYVRYGDVIENLERSYPREQLLQLCSGAGVVVLGGKPHVVFKMEGEEVKIVSPESFEKLFPVVEYKSIIPA